MFAGGQGSGQSPHKQCLHFGEVFKWVKKRESDRLLDTQQSLQASMLEGVCTLRACSSRT